MWQCVWQIWLPLLCAALVSTTKPSPLPHKQFVWLRQTDTLPKKHLPKPTSVRDVIWLTYHDPSGDVFFPNSTYSQGRNRLLDEAISRAVRMPLGGYLYYIFMDGDVDLQTRTTREHHYRPSLPADPFDCFETFLVEWEPAVGSVAYAWPSAEPKGISTFHSNDALLQAQHRETLSFGLPCMDLDCHSWYYQQHVMNNINAVLYNTQRVQMNAVFAVNHEHTFKPFYRRDTMWEKSRCFFMNALRSNSPLRSASVESPLPMTTSGCGRKRGNNSYIVPMDFIRSHFHTSHPLVLRSLHFRARADVQQLLRAAAQMSHHRFTPDPRSCIPQTEDLNQRCFQVSCPSTLHQCRREFRLRRVVSV
eukprot:GGOE01011510.1.p1 GENE.GGOE01011510.1~~GGOE01011510.1.p1  ORF type:complete len:388 (-),score=68.33 GGOE01011510.1:101-1186(-)